MMNLQLIYLCTYKFNIDLHLHTSIHIYRHIDIYIHIYIHLYIYIYIYYILWANFKKSLNTHTGKIVAKIFKFDLPTLGNFSKILMRGKCKKAQGNSIPHALHYTIFCPQSQPSISRSIQSMASSTFQVSPILVPFGL